MQISNKFKVYGASLFEHISSQNMQAVQGLAYAASLLTLASKMGIDYSLLRNKGSHYFTV